MFDILFLNIFISYNSIIIHPLNILNLTNILATIGAFGCGNVLAWPAPALEAIVDCADCDISLTKEEGSWVAATAYIGCVCVGPFAGLP